MIKFLLIVIAVLIVGIVGLFLSLFIQNKLFNKRVQDEIDAYNKKVNDKINKANKDKASLHTGNAEQDFKNSIEALKK